MMVCLYKNTQGASRLKASTVLRGSGITRRGRLGKGLLSEALIGTEAPTQRWESREHPAGALNVFWALWTHICLEPSDRQVVEQEWRWEGVESQSVFS